MLGLLLSCNSPSSPGEQSQTPTAASTDLFPDKVHIQYAKGFTIEYFPNYKVVTVRNPFEKQSDTVRYVLVQRGTPHPQGYSDAQMIEIPIRNLVAMSSMHIGLAGFLEEEDKLIGLGNLKYVSSPAIQTRITEGKITEVGDEGALNEERLITMHPDLLMTMGSPTATLERYKLLTDAGIHVLINSEWIETTPLGRTEWVKLLATLFNKEALVNARFAEVEQEYNRLANLTRNVTRKPSLITGMNYKDSWFVPDGDSYMGQFFKDAGASYHWSDTKTTGSLALNFETVYQVGLEADYWLNLGYVDSKQDILAKDVRYGDLRPFKTGNMYNYNKRVNAQGANDYWESGAVSPHIVLADLIKILHPDLLPDHELVYYKQIN